MNTDEKGNKIAEKKISKKTKSADKRERMMAAAKRGEKPHYCPECGFRKRSKKHGVEFCTCENKLEN